MQDIVAVILEIQQGNERLREEFVSSNLEKIRQYASFICRRTLDWQNDDELSISLAAFNRGVDRFDGDRGVDFYPFARQLIKNSLIDYFKSLRKENALEAVSLERESFGSPVEVSASQREFSRELEKRERAYEIHRFAELLGEFSLTLEDLVRSSPSHRDTREMLKGLARRVGEDNNLVERIYREKKLPMKEIQLLTGAKRKTLEKWRRYLLSLVIIRSCEELDLMGQYIWGMEGVSGSEES